MLQSSLANHYAEVRRRLTQPVIPVAVAKKKPSHVVYAAKFGPWLVPRRFRTVLYPDPFGPFVRKPYRAALKVKPRRNWILLKECRCARVVGIAVLVAQHYGMEPALLLGNRRLLHVARARQVVMYIAHEHDNKSYAEIGNALNRDHSTVIYGVQHIAELLAAGDAALRDDIPRLLSKIRDRLVMEAA